MRMFGGYPFDGGETLNVLLLELAPATNGPLAAQLLAATFDGRFDESLKEYESGSFVFTLHPRHREDLERFWHVCDGPLRAAFLMNNSFGRFTAIKKSIDLPKDEPVTLTLLVVNLE